ncbi:MAG TPA: hypothetical protein VGM63_05010, partial [Mucilaginibacter sp.]
SVHRFNDLRKEYCRTSFDNFKTTSSGDVSFWKFVPRYYIGGLILNEKFDFHLLKVEIGIISLEDNKISWYIDGDFDFGYQGLTSVTEINNELIFTVQRDGSLYRYNLDHDKIIDKIKLAGNHGNPQPIIKNGEVWVSDYDTLIRLNNWQVIKSKKLQEAAGGLSQFIGSFSFNSQNGLCIIARPFSGDVICVNKDFKIKYICNTGKQPLEAVLMQDNTVIARDWKTGDLLRGQLKKKWF